MNAGGTARGNFWWELSKGVLRQQHLPHGALNWLAEHEAKARAKPERPSYHHSWVDGAWQDSTLILFPRL